MRENIILRRLKNIFSSHKTIFVITEEDEARRRERSEKLLRKQRRFIKIGIMRNVHHSEAIYAQCDAPFMSFE